MALEKAGVSLVAENFQTYMSQLAAIQKAQKEAFSDTNLKDYQDAVRKLGDAYKNVPKSFPKPELPTPKDTDSLQKALDYLGQTGKYAISQISEETLKLKAALQEVSKSGKFEIGKIEPIKSNILGDLTAQLDEALKRGDGLKAMFYDLEGFLSSQFVSTIAKIGGVLAAAFSVNAIKNFIEGLINSSVEANKQFEGFRTQFTTLLKSADKANERIAELAEFGVKTPYELPEIVQADKLLQTFGGTAIATGKSLKLIGDAAAAVDTPFQNVAFWFGRMYSSMQAGRPFGEASARLQELGILSGDVRNKLEDMQKSGKSGADMWEYFSGVLDKNFSGAMERLSHTLKGVQSNLSDLQGMLLREGGEEYFDVLRKQTIELYEYLSKDKIQSALVDISKAFGDIAANVRENVFGAIVDSIKTIQPESLEGFATAIGEVADAAKKLTGLQSINLDGFVKSINGLVSAGAGLIEFTNVLKDAGGYVSGITPTLTAFGKANDNVKETVLGILNPLYGAGNAYNDLNQKIKDATGSSIADWIGSVEQQKAPLTDAQHKLDALGQTIEGNYDPNVEQAANLTNDFGEAVYDTTAIIERQKDAIKGQIEALEAQAKALEKAQDINQKYNDTVSKAKSDYDKGLADATEKYQTERAKKIADFQKEMVEFEADGARKRKKMIDDYNVNVQNSQRQFDLQRQQAEQNYNLKVAQDKKKFYDDQARALKEFQLSQAQAQRDFSITDRRLRAEGDVLALMEAREDFQNQQQTNVENFNSQQQNAKDAFTQQQTQAAENFRLQEEQARQSYALQTDIQREEFQRRLAEFDENLAIERQKRIDANAQEMADLDAKFEEEKAKLYEDYQNKLAMAAEQKDKELAALGDSLKAQGTVTEEGMKEIASKISELFGSDQAGDQLIKGWSERSASTIGSAVDEISAKIAELKRQLESVGTNAPTPSPGRGVGFGSNPGTIANPPASSSSNRPIGMRQGGSGIVTGPQTFQVEPGVKEHVAFTPLSSMGNIRLSGRAGIDVTGLPAGTSPDVGNRLADTLVKELGMAVKRLSRRGSG